MITRLFRIPERIEQLVDEENFPDNYLVKNVISFGELANCLQEAERAMRTSGGDYIFEHFDTYYACINHYSQLDIKLRLIVWVQLRTALQKVSQELNYFFEHFTMDNREHQQNKLSMICYAFVTFAELFLEPDNARGKKGGLADKTKSAVKLESDLQQASVALVNILTNRLGSLFKPLYYLTSYVILVTKFPYKVLEKVFPTGGAINKFKALFDTVASIIGIALEKYDNSSRNCAKVVELFQTNESFSTTVAALVAHNIQNHGGQVVIHEIIDQIKKINVVELCRDSSCPRTISQFLVELCERQTETMFKCVQELFEFLDMDSYLLRNAVLEVITIILQKMFKSPKVKRDQSIKEMLLGKLEDHIYDVSSYTRNRCMQMWTELANEDAIPTNWILDIVEAAIGRLQDKSPLVRKSALAFLIATLNRKQFVVIYKSDLNYLKKVYQAALERTYKQLEEMNQEQARRVESMAALGGEEQETKCQPKVRKEDNEEEGDDDDEKKIINTGSRKRNSNGKDEGPSNKMSRIEVDDRLKVLANTWFDVEQSLVDWWQREGRQLEFTGTGDQLPEEMDIKQKEASFEFFRKLMLARRFVDALNVLTALRIEYPTESCFQKIQQPSNGNDDEANGIEVADLSIEVGNGTVPSRRSSIRRPVVAEDEDDDEEGNIQMFSVLDYNDILFMSPIVTEEGLNRLLPFQLALAKLVFLDPLLHFGQSNVENLDAEEEDQVAIQTNDQQLAERFNKLSDEITANQRDAEEVEKILVKLQKAVNLFRMVEQYRQMMADAMPTLTTMMMSKNSSDVLEAISFFLHAHRMRFTSSNESIRKMLKMMVVKEKTIKDALIEALESIFLKLGDSDILRERPTDERTTSAREMRNLCRLVATLNQGELVCAQIMLSEFFQRKKLSRNHLNFLWEAFTRKRADVNEEEARAALAIIGMIASVNPSFVQNEANLTIMIQMIFDEEGQHKDWRLISETLEAFLKSFHLPSTEVKETGAEKFFKLPQNHELFVKAGDVLMESITSNLSNQYWYRMCSAIFRLIYTFSEQPDQLGTEIFKRCFQKLDDMARNRSTTLSESLSNGDGEAVVNDQVENETGATSQSEEEISTQATTVASGAITTSLLNGKVLDDVLVARLIYMIGELAINVLIYLELHLRQELTIRQNIREKERNQFKVNKREKEKEKAAANKKKSTAGRRSTIAHNTTIVSEDEDDETAQVLGSNPREDPNIHRIDEVISKEILFDKSCLLSRFRDPIRRLVLGEDGFQSTPLVRQFAIVTMTKLMLLSPEYNRANLYPLLRVFAATNDNAIRRNMIVCLADLTQRAPTCCDQNCTKAMFNCLRDEDDSVKMAALKILSRLILTAMIRPDTVNIVRLITYPNKAISDTARLFFIELSKSNNQKLYHDSFNNFIAQCHGGVDPKQSDPMSETEFQETAKFLFELETKPGAFDFVVSSIITQFKKTNNERAWRDLSFCLAQFTCNETGFKALTEGFFYFEKALGCDVVYKNITETLNNYRKNKADTKGRGSELEERIKAAREKATNKL